MAASAENANPPKVIVVGAGPVGLFVALQLAQAGILVEVMEKEAALSDAPRAAGYHGETMLALARAKVLEKARRQGTDTTGFCWRKPLADDGNGGKRYGDIIARMPLTRRDSHSADGFASLLILPQSKLAKLFIDDALATGLVKVYFNMELTAIQDDGQSVKATFTKPGGGLQETHEGLFLVGADGGKSTTRKLLDIPFKGFSWPERLVAMDCVFATPETMETEFSTSCIVHPTNFGVLVPLEPFEPGRRSLYRCSAAVDPHDSRSDDELVSEESLDDLLDMMVPGPRPLNVEVVRAAPYRIHQLCASTFRRGRCLLAGDAAHLSNVSDCLIPRIGCESSVTNTLPSCSPLERWVSVRGCSTPRRSPTRSPS